MLQPFFGAGGGGGAASAGEAAALPLGAASGDAEPFDQFAVNRALGVDTNAAAFPAEVYTSRLDTSRFTPAQLAAADKLAKEIDERGLGDGAVAHDDDDVFTDVPRTGAAGAPADAFTDAAIAGSAAAAASHGGV